MNFIKTLNWVCLGINEGAFYAGLRPNEAKR
jgi:hypothetical protein